MHIFRISGTRPKGNWTLALSGDLEMALHNILGGFGEYVTV